MQQKTHADMDSNAETTRTQSLPEPGHAIVRTNSTGHNRRKSLPSLRTQLARGSVKDAQMTPPDTPQSPQETVGSALTEEGLFHNYLRAFHPFDPSTSLSADDEASSITIPIRQGDLILVHSVHANGWADGTLLSTGMRGWLPTNYCEPYDHPYLRNLLNAMTQFWDLLGNSEDASFSMFVRQDYIRGLIAGVRYLLEHADCLHRDAPLVLRHIGIRRMRKGLLADLSTMVQKAKELQEEASQPYAGEVIHIVLDELIAKAFKVVTRAVKFVDTWSQESADECSQYRLPTIHEPPTPPVEADCPVTRTVTEHQSDLQSARNSAICSTQGNAQGNNTGTARFDFTTATTDQKSARPPSAEVASHDKAIAHRLSLIHVDTRPGALASEQLAQAHDLCISHIGKFIGHHLQSRTPAELVQTVAHLVSSCASLSTMMDKVATRDLPHAKLLQPTRIELQAKLEDLITSTKDAFSFSDSPDDDAIMLPAQSNRLVAIATTLIRTVGECVTNTRSIIERVGDFVLDSSPATTSSLTNAFTNEPNDTLYSEQPQHEAQASSGALPGNGLTWKMLPPPPPVRQRALTATEAKDFALPSPARTTDTDSPMTPFSGGSHKSLPLPPIQGRSAVTVAQSGSQITESLCSPRSLRSDSTSPARKDSISASVTESTGTHHNSFRDSEMTVVSEVSTRATTPDHESALSVPNLLNSFGSIASIRSVGTDVSSDAESQLLVKTFAHELVLSKDGQVTGGTLPALVEQLTLHDNAPDAQFLTSFYTTFRLFTTPRHLAQALIDRFEYIGDSKIIGTPVRLRICNLFKGWLETYWSAEADRDALGDIRYFALHKLKPQLPSAADRLVELTRKVTAAYHTGTITGPLVSGVGKTSTAIGTQYANEASAPDSAITRSQLSSLRLAVIGGGNCSIVDLDPLELARQLTLLASRIFCDIQAEEFLSLDWNKKGTIKARNVRNVCKMNTDLSFVVGDTILSPEDPKKRALVIKQWVKIAKHCHELNNYETLMAVVVSVNSATVQRLKRTWELVSKKTRATLDELNLVVDFSKNHKDLRRRLETPTAPCLPFLGVYLTDLTFADAGNPKVRDLPGSAAADGGVVSVINFDKYMRMAKIISHVQRFQVPYKLHTVPEMQAWLESYLNRMREAHDGIVGNFHRRSLLLEPRSQDFKPLKTADGKRDDTRNNTIRPKTAGDKPEQPMKEPVFLKSAFGFKTALGRYDLPAPDEAEEQRQ